jgi:hypothetical protein
MSKKDWTFLFVIWSCVLFCENLESLLALLTLSKGLAVDCLELENIYC